MTRSAAIRFWGRLVARPAQWSLGPRAVDTPADPTTLLKGWNTARTRNRPPSAPGRVGNGADKSGRTWRPRPEHCIWLTLDALLRAGILSPGAYRDGVFKCRHPVVED